MNLRPLPFVLLLACAHANKPSAPPPVVRVPERACASTAQGAPLPLYAAASAAQLISDHGTRLEAYQSEGGVWLAKAPVLVNREFDFALAAGVEGGVGAGLAAAKRREGNDQVAVLLRELSLTSELVRELDSLRACGVHVYFVLWGPAEESVLKLVGEAPEQREQPARVIEGAKHSADDWGKGSALSDEAGALLEQFASPHEG